MDERLKEIIMTVLELSEDIELNEDTDLTALGLDSMTCVEVVVNLEEEFGVTVEEEDLLVENMASINCIKKLLEKYQ